MNPVPAGRDEIITLSIFPPSNKRNPPHVLMHLDLAISKDLAYRELAYRGDKLLRRYVRESTDILTTYCSCFEKAGVDIANTPFHPSIRLLSILHARVSCVLRDQFQDFAQFTSIPADLDVKTTVNGGEEELELADSKAFSDFSEAVAQWQRRWVPDLNEISVHSGRIRIPDRTHDTIHVDSIKVGSRDECVSYLMLKRAVFVHKRFGDILNRMFHRLRHFASSYSHDRTPPEAYRVISVPSNMKAFYESSMAELMEDLGNEMEIATYIFNHPGGTQRSESYYKNVFEQFKNL